MAYQIKKIAGVQCVFAQMPSASTIMVQAIVKVGWACEDPNNSGISHFLEHILCKGSERWHSQDEFADFRVDQGIKSNAFTWMDFTRYFFEHLKDKHTLGLELLADRIVNPAMRENDIEKEKSVIYQELQRAMSNNDRIFWESIKENYYNGQIGCILWTEKTIYGMTKQQLLDRKNMRYTKDNLLIVITGWYEKQEEFEQMIAEKFASLPEHCSWEYRTFPKNVNQKSEFVFDLGLKQSQIALYMPTPYENSKYWEAFDILAYFIGSTPVGKLYKYLRNELGLAYAINMKYVEFLWSNRLEINGGLIKEKEQEGIAAIHQVLDELCNGISQAELERAKKRMTNSLLRGTENPNLINNFIRWQWLLWSELLTIEEKRQRIEAVTLAEVNAQCKFLSRENRWLFLAH